MANDTKSKPADIVGGVWRESAHGTAHYFIGHAVICGRSFGCLWPVRFPGALGLNSGCNDCIAAILRWAGLR